MENPDDPIDRFIQSLPPMSDGQRFETVLNYFNRALQSEATSSLKELRAHLFGLHPDTPEERLILDVIDGLLVLREMDAG